MVTMIAWSTTKDKNRIFTLIDNEYNIKNIEEKQLMEIIKAGKIQVSNLGLEDDKIVSTNGSLSKYPNIDMLSGVMKNTYCGIILNKVEQDDKILKYTVILGNGEIIELSLEQTLKFNSTYGIVNGKVRHTNSGDIIQPIKGVYPSKKIEIEQVVEHKIIFNTLYITSAISSDKSQSPVEFVGIRIECDNMAMITKMYNKLREENKVIQKRLEAIGATSKTVSNIQLKRMGGNSLFAVISYSTYLNLIENKSVEIVFSLGGTTIVSSSEYGSDGLEAETSFYLTSDLKIADNDPRGNYRTLMDTRRLADDIKDKLKDKKIVSIN